MMTADRERWAEALAIERWKGTDAPAFITERIATLAASPHARFCMVQRRTKQID